MPSFKRRHFLQLAGSTLASLGLSQLNLSRQGDRYGRVLAQETSRKLALLVGVNHYPDGISNLGGCTTDVRMQYELLVHRFGFNPSDIVILSDPLAGWESDNPILPPTRDNLLAAFEAHLIGQAKDGDVVVFHYSGHGSRVIDANPIPIFAPYNGTMMPADARLAHAQAAEANRRPVDDIMGKTLFLLTHLLPTDNVTTVLDSCYSGGGTRGNLLYRAVDARGGEAEPSDRELAYQESLLSKTDFTEATLLAARTRGIAKGVAIGSAQANQYAADATFGSGENRFKAGAFTMFSPVIYGSNR